MPLLERVSVAAVIKAMNDGLAFALVSPRRREGSYISEKGFPIADFWLDFRTSVLEVGGRCSLSKFFRF